MCSDHKFKGESDLSKQRKKYTSSKQVQDVDDHFNARDLYRVASHLKNGITCKKYNYTLDKEAQVINQYESRIQLSQDETELIIYNQKPILKDDKVNIDIDEQLEKGMKKEEINEILDDNDSDDDGIDDEFDYVCTKSKSSCKVSQIKSFLFGGISSRFWMLRKHINSMPIEELHNLPFYSWECITLQTEKRSVDLVIQDK